MSKTKKIDGLSLVKELKGFMADALNEQFASSGLVTPLEHDEPLEEHVRRDATEAEWTLLGDEERFVVMRLKELARHCGGDQGAYEEGLLSVSFKNRQGVLQFADALELDDQVVTYEIHASHEDLDLGYMEDADIDNVIMDGNFEFEIDVVINPEIVQFAPEEIEVEDGVVDVDDDNGFIMEVRRRIKVNFSGKRRVKMQCRPGFKWDAGRHTCVKITGAEVAQKRLQLRRAVRTKKAKGQSFKVRVLRKTRKANRFRKSMGLK